MITKIADVVYEQLTGETELQNNPFPEKCFCMV
jgi:hypothetical protein